MSAFSTVVEDVHCEAWLLVGCVVAVWPFVLLRRGGVGVLWLGVGMCLANKPLGILKLGIGAPVIAELMMIFLVLLGVVTSNKLVV